MSTELQTIADELYGLPLDEFVAKRDSKSSELRKLKDKALADSVKALPKPTLPAWVVNQMRRHQSKDISELLDVGEQMRAAQESLKAEDIRGLAAQKTALLKQFGKQAEALALKLDQPLSEDARAEVEATLAAALADAEAAQAVRGGRLTKSIHYSGFGISIEAFTAIPTANTPPMRHSAEIGETDAPRAKSHAGHVDAKPETKHRAEPASSPPEPKLEARAEKKSEAEKPDRAARAALAEQKMAAAREALKAAEEEAAEIRREEAAEALERAQHEVEQAKQIEEQVAKRCEERAGRVKELQDELQVAEDEHRHASQDRDEARKTLAGAQKRLAELEEDAGS